MRAGGIVVVVALVVLAAAGVSSAQGLFGPTQDPIAGEKLFTAKGCVRCHAVNGAGGNVGPDLAGVPRPHTFFDLAAALWNHTPKMAARMKQLGLARPQLDGREVGDLTAYLYTLNYFDRKGDVAAGRRLFSEKHCAECHAVGRKGSGAGGGPDLTTLAGYGSPIGIASAMWNHAAKMSARMQQRGIARPTFQGSELVDLIAYLKSAAPKPRRVEVYVLPGNAGNGRLLFADKRCVVCHPLVRRGDEEGPDLIEGQAQKSLTEFAAAMWNKAPRMLQSMEGKQIAPPTLRPDEMSDLVAYLYSVRYFQQSGDPRRGVIAAVNKGCLDCHALYGERGKPASDLTQAKNLDVPARVLASLWNHTFVDDPRPPKDRVAWSTFRGDEMSDLMAYLRTLKRQP